MGVTWRSCKQYSNGYHAFVGDIKIAGVVDVLDIVSNFNEHAGCTWRIGKTGVDRIFERAVHYECVHRVPTHVGMTTNIIQVGKNYKMDRFGDRTLVCIRDEGSGDYIFYDKVDGKEFSVNNAEKGLFMIGNSRLSFGCRAKLTFRKAVAGLIVVQVDWSHNHDVNAFATTRRRDPAMFVKTWFVNEYSKGVPPMKALRSYISQVIEECGTKGRVIANVLADRYVN